ncbi:MAG TPA: hypothetical protein VI603_19275 [Saprospiraceae bacterium]|nr:hypothetical protein [Saprospiraceae bacterium]
MKTTKYFEFRRQQADRIGILDEWIELVLSNPEAKEIQQDGRIKFWRKIPEANNKYLRVIVLDDGETVHNAFFDRDFK